MNDFKGISFEYRRAVILFLICLMLILAANTSLAGEKSFLSSPHARFSGTANIVIKDKRISADLENADIPDVLTKIEKGIGVKTTIGQGLTGKTVTTKFEDKDIEGALREVLRGYYYVLSYAGSVTEEEKKTLTQINAKGDVIGSKTLKGHLIKVEIPYGSGIGAVGAHEGAEGSSDGPPSYAVDNHDNILILDRLNNRVQVYSSLGSYLSTIPLRNNIVGKGVEIPSNIHDPVDIDVDSFGYFYVYDSDDRIYQYDKNGNINSSIKVNNGGWGNSVGPMKIVNNELFMDVGLCGDASGFCGLALLGRIGPDKKLVRPTAEEAKQPRQAREFQSGKTYKGRQYIKGYNRELDIFDATGMLFETISIPADDILTRDILGEDKNANSYFQIRTVENKDRLYNIDEFRPDGDYVGTAQIPGGTYYVFPATKKIIVNENGNIYNYVPEKDSLKVFVFINESGK